MLMILFKLLKILVIRKDVCWHSFQPSLTIENINQLQKLLETFGEATENRNWKVAMEFRNSSWYEREVYELLEEFNVSMVIHDIPRSATPAERVAGILFICVFMALSQGIVEIIVTMFYNNMPRTFKDG
jgi:uncharacterized protein YecE (DUF72 family)